MIFGSLTTSRHRSVGSLLMVKFLNRFTLINGHTSFQIYEFHLLCPFLFLRPYGDSSLFLASVDCEKCVSSESNGVGILLSVESDCWKEDLLNCSGINGEETSKGVGRGAVISLAVCWCDMVTKQVMWLGDLLMWSPHDFDVEGEQLFLISIRCFFFSLKCSPNSFNMISCVIIQERLCN